MKFNHKIFERLAQIFSEENKCVSIFIPTDRTGNGQAAQIRLKNQLGIAADKLMDDTIMDTVMNKQEAEEYLAKGYELLGEGKEAFWSHQSDGLVLFIGEDTFEYYTMPVDFKVFTYVDNVFYLRPMLASLTSEDRFFILALSQNEVRFFEGSKHSITPVIINDLVPESVEETLVGVEFPEQLQTHSGGANNPIFHGQGGAKDYKEIQITSYFRQVDEGLMEMLHDEKVPLIIAAVDYLVPMYKEISKYKYIVAENVGGNPEQDGPVLLHEKAWAYIKEIKDKQRAEKTNTFNELLPQGQASLSMNEIAPAALNGKVHTLFVDKDASVVWGTYRPEKNWVTVQATQNKKNSCLLNFAAISTYLQGGKVFNIERVEMPHPFGVLNAIYRY